MDGWLSIGFSWEVGNMGDSGEVLVSGGTEE